MNFIAFDFETANQKRSSACSLAIVMVRDNKIIDSFYSLINPHDNFHYRNTQIHHITAEQVQDAPTFAEIWPHIKPLFNQNSLVVAHNAPFDNSVLKACLKKYELDVPNFLSLDTVKTSRNFYPDLPNHKLNTVSDYLEIELDNHHNALADSLACANILINQQQQFGNSPLKKLVKQV
ncbi:3'-5' exonuclease [Holzapfeliella sp. He02]|uniref:3'-5' exonuclease n=1 Tax=Holzapfeliella saturejae TaxID=3082953 RepID=A0ABU8SHS7_9LACO